MHRFFTDPSSIHGDSIPLSPEDAAHIRALRLRPAELFTVCNGAGTDYICRLGEKGGSTSAEIVETCPSCGEPAILCDIYIGLAKGDRLDFAVQKSVELGARSVTVFPSERSVVGDSAKKTARLQRIALEAAKQSGRGIVPEVTSVESFHAAVVLTAQAELPLFCYEDEQKTSLKTALLRAGEVKTVSILTGPEGGFTPEEAATACSVGMVSVTLGSRILRCETAPIATLAAVMFHMVEL